ncbi:hypothetical protein DMB90_11970 [Raoultella planticola]|uniref:ABC transmembrane type-1 domain-containing protein n=1 Tax=Raoultella planticola TaxID=575 RepID=A0A5P6A9X3_RAOPL|nr:hypothetical protein DMB90_11970 [Raoultella planticola]
MALSSSSGAPLAWFKERQAGVTVARVHELKTVREFLTGSALTLCTDLLFMVIFFVVMAFYSIPLTLIVIISLVLRHFIGGYHAISAPSSQRTVSSGSAESGFSGGEHHGD